MSKSYKVTAVATLSSALECYDFVIYAALIPYLNANFFSNVSEELGVFYTLMVFAVGYVSRPLGGVVFGALGDKYGRKKTFIYTTALMALSTMLISILPTVSQVGSVSTVLLIVLRYIQGVSQGGEVPGAITFVVEHVKSGKTNTNCAFIYLGLGFGALLSSSICYVLTGLLSESSMIEWGWRLPFAFGGVLAVGSYFIRKSTQESPHYKAMPKLEGSQKPIVYLLKFHWRELIRGFSMVILVASLVAFTLTYPAYMRSFTEMSASSTYLIMCIGMLTMAVFAPIFGRLSDKCGGENVFRNVALACVFLCPLILNMVSQDNTLMNAAVMFSVQVMIAGLLGSFPALLANLFPSKVRYTGIAVSYNLAFAVGAFVPALSNSILSHLPLHYLVGILFSFIGILSLSIGPKRGARMDFLLEEKKQILMTS